MTSMIIEAVHTQQQARWDQVVPIVMLYGPSHVSL